MNWQIREPINQAITAQGSSKNESFKQTSQKDNTTFTSIQTGKQNGIKLPAQQDLIVLFNSYNANNSSILQMLKPLSYQNRIKLQKFCIEKFQNLPIFLLYELSTELSLPQLHQLCISKLLQQNYEQFNYLRMDLLKISLNNFHKIFQEYYDHVNSLEIQGLRGNDLKSVIGDYCMMNAIDEEGKQQLIKKYAQPKGIGFAVSKGLTVGVTGQKEVRRSMIETRKGEIQIETPLRGKNSTIALPRTPNPSHISSATELPDVKPSIRRSFRNIKTLRSNQQQGNFTDSKQSAIVIKKQIEQFNKKQSELYSQILSTKKQVEENQNQNEIKQSLSKLARSMNQMEKQVQIQNKKLEQLQKSLFEIERENVCGTKCGYGFGF